VQCPKCGKDDRLDLDFCASCGAFFKRKASSQGYSDHSGRVYQGQELTYEQLLRNTVYGLFFTIFMGLFILYYLAINGADPFLIIFVEVFPIMWFVLILLQWRANKGRIKNGK
jgi:ABC-type transport system involved in Fe-S cluster assembly fused permease/ATPase subunit